MPYGGSLIIECSNASLGDQDSDLHAQVGPGDYVLVTVNDTGSGMSPELKTQVLEPFFTTKGVGEGSGLGLPMALGFTKQSGGDLVIHSQLGLGTTIKLYLPRAVDAADRAEPSEQLELPRGKGETVLIVEDESEVLTLATTMLGSLGYQTLAAGDSLAALEILVKDPKIDLLLTDVVLPGGMSGPNLAKEAKGLYGDLKVLFMSGYAQSMAHHSGSLGVRHELVREPFRRIELAQSLRATLDR